MTITRWKPFEDFMSMQNRINRLFQENIGRERERENEGSCNCYPVTDIFETQEAYVFKMEVPGLNKDDIKVEFHENTLSIKGERKENKEIKEENYHRIESFSGTFSRTFSLPRNIDASRIEAMMKDGLLELRIAKAEEAKAKAIPISVH